MSSSAPPDPIVSNTTPLRYFTLVDRIDLLVRVLDGRIHVPRQVFNPDEQVDSIPALLSEIGRSEARWAASSTDNPAATENWSRLMALRNRSDIEVVDLTDDELTAYSQLITPEFAREMNLAHRLGPGEAAVIAIAEAREWGAAVDERAATRVLEYRCPDVGVVTTMELLRRAVPEILNSFEAQDVYREMLEKGYRGPDSLW